MVKTYGGYSGAFVPTTNVWDPTELQDLDVTKPEFKELLVRLYQNLNNISQVLNLKVTGYYYPQEFVTGKKFFPNPTNAGTTSASQQARQGFIMTVIFGALPNSTTKSVPHNITCTAHTSLIFMCAGSTDSTDLLYVPIPYASASGNNIELNMDDTNVNITTNSDWSSYTNTMVYIEYLKN